ncbi:MAG: hypothetical protein NTV46_13430 [Verrucomicrobia bacterium]|nr:hypothetical protein [Verrucomicrobiota bacterium]
MNAIPRILLLTLALAGWTMAGLPKKAPITLYAGLWTNSPFTSKPPPPAPVETVNPLEDYSLAGVSPIGGAYRITLLNKKKPEERLIIDSDKPNGEFKILEVTYTAGDPLATVVSLSTGSKTGTVAFDEKYLTLVAAPTAKVNPKGPSAATIPGMQPPMQPGQQPQHQPRPRVVPPSSPTSQPQDSSNRRPVQRGGR